MDEGDKADLCFIVQLIEHVSEIVLIGRRRQGRHLLYSSVDIALTRDYLDETKAGDKADICFIVQLIEHSPETVLIGGRRPKSDI